MAICKFVVILSCCGIALHASMPRPESFEEIKQSLDLIGIVRVAQISEQNPNYVDMKIVEVFKGNQAGMIRVKWPLAEKPIVDADYYAFLKEGADREFSCSSVWWKCHRVTERPAGKEPLGNRINHSDCYWVLTSESAFRYPYGKKSTVTRWPVDYVIQRGDSLNNLAARFYGDSRRWRRIWESNVWIGEPGRLQVGMTIQVPSISDYD